MIHKNQKKILRILHTSNNTTTIQKIMTSTEYKKTQSANLLAHNFFLKSNKNSHKISDSFNALPLKYMQIIHFKFF